MQGHLLKTNVKRGLKKGESVWRIILYLGRDAETGKQRQKWFTFRGTKNDAERKRRELIGEVENDKLVEPSKVTLGQWLDEWLKLIQAQVAAGRKAPNTYRAYSVIVKHLKDPKTGLGHVPLQRLTSRHVERYYADLKLAANTKLVHYIVLNSALKRAVKDKMIRENVARDAENKPRPASKTEDLFHKVWTADEASRFLTHVKSDGDTQCTALFAVALDSGCRRNELLGLQWRDIDLDKRTLRVERQLMKGGRNAPEFAKPKRGRVRSMELSEETIALLIAHKREQAELKMANRTSYVDNGLIFAQTWSTSNARHAVLGAPLWWTSLNHRLDALSAASGVRRITLHGLRHTCATLMLQAGVQPHVVQQRLGHAQVEMTLNIYGHALPDMQRDAAARLAALVHAR